MSGSVLIVGTTPDYVAKLFERYSKSLLFLTDRRFQEDPLLQKLPPSSLTFASLEKSEEACRKTHEGRLFSLEAMTKHTMLTNSTMNG